MTRAALFLAALFVTGACALALPTAVAAPNCPYPPAPFPSPVGPLIDTLRKEVICQELVCPALPSTLPVPWNTYQDAMREAYCDQTACPPQPSTLPYPLSVFEDEVHAIVCNTVSCPKPPSGLPHPMGLIQDLVNIIYCDVGFTVW